MADAFTFIDSDGVERFLGNNVPPDGLTMAWPVYGDSDKTPLYSRGEWDKLLSKYETGADHWALPPVHDQNGYGMCNASATAAAMEFCRKLQGLPYKKISAGDLYGRINGGRDQGSMLEDGLRVSMRDGVASTATCEYLDWRGRSGNGVDADRKNYKVLEAFVCPTFDHCFSAVLSGYALISGVVWYNNYTPDSDGWLPSGRGGGGGHAIFGYKPASRNGKYGIWHQNSWTERYGLRGRFAMPEGAYGTGIGGWWAVRSITDEGGVIPPIQE